MFLYNGLKLSCISTTKSLSLHLLFQFVNFLPCTIKLSQFRLLPRHWVNMMNSWSWSWYDPKLEYAVVILYSIQEYFMKIKRIQRWGIKMVLSVINLTYMKEEKLKWLCLLLLKERRERRDLNAVYWVMKRSTGMTCLLRTEEKQQATARKWETLAFHIDGLIFEMVYRRK